MMPYNPYAALGRKPQQGGGKQQALRAAGVGLEGLGAIFGGGSRDEEEQEYDPMNGYHAALAYYDKPTSANLEALLGAMRPRPLRFKDSGFFRGRG